MKRGRPLRVDPKAAAVRRAQREARRAENPRPEDSYERPQDAARRDGADERERARFRREVCVDGCLMCEHFPPTREEMADFSADIRWLEAHHVTPQQVLKRTGLAAYLWDPDNGVCLCVWHHSRHENGTQRIPFVLLPTRSIMFASRHGLAYLLDGDRRYARDA
jgi:hypothetical protein